MSSLLERWTRLSAWIRWPVGIALVAISYALAYALVASVLGLDPGQDDSAIRSLVIAFTTPLLVAGVLWQRRRLGGKGQLGLYRRAYRTGTVPDGANVEQWRPVAHRQLRFFREARRVFLWLWIAFGTVVAIGTAMALLVNGRWITAAVAAAVLAAVFAALGYGLDRLYRWRVGQFTRLQRALDDSDGQSRVGSTG